MISDKHKLRKLFLDKHKSIIDQAEQLRVEKALFGLPEFSQAKNVLLYYSISGEISTHTIIETCLADGKSVYLPKIVSDTKLEFGQVFSVKDLESGPFSIFEPVKTGNSLISGNNTVCVVPAVSCDIYRHRLGHGKGYYDRFLSENSVFSIGLCRKDCFVDSLPVEMHDYTLDVVIVDGEVIRS